MVVFSTDYQRLVNSYAREEISRDGIEWTIANFFKLMIVVGSENFKGNVRNWVFKLLETRPGVELIHKITLCREWFFVREGHCHFDYGERSVFIDLRVNRERFGFKNWEKILFEVPFEIILAHELIHLLDALLNLEKALSDFQTSPDLLSRFFPNKEELKAITGLDSVYDPLLPLVEVKDETGKKGIYSFTAVSENSFLAAYGLPLRTKYDDAATDEEKETERRLKQIHVGSLLTIIVENCKHRRQKAVLAH
jgi:hypothetical protein